MTFKWHKLLQLQKWPFPFLGYALLDHWPPMNSCDSSPETSTEPPEPMMGDRKFWTRGDCGRFGGHFEGMVDPVYPLFTPLFRTAAGDCHWIFLEETDMF